MIADYNKAVFESVKTLQQYGINQAPINLFIVTANTYCLEIDGVKCPKYDYIIDQ